LSKSYLLFRFNLHKNTAENFINQVFNASHDLNLSSSVAGSNSFLYVKITFLKLGYPNQLTPEKK
jgi:hypothetical protein